jgi:hypothetical protein
LIVDLSSGLRLSSGPRCGGAVSLNVLVQQCRPADPDVPATGRLHLVIRFWKFQTEALECPG